MSTTRADIESSVALDMDAMPGHYIRRLQQVAVRLFSEEVGSELTPVQFAALIAIAQRSGLGQADLAAQIGYDRATIGGVIDRLEAKGWVSRTPSREDRRQNIVAITPAGEQAMAQATSAVERVQTRFLSPLNSDEQQVFEQMCRKLLEYHLG